MSEAASKILPAVEIRQGVNDQIRFYEDWSGMEQTATLDPGWYYVSWDGGPDDLCRHIEDKMREATGNYVHFSVLVGDGLNSPFLGMKQGHVRIIHRGYGGSVGFTLNWGWNSRTEGLAVVLGADADAGVVGTSGGDSTDEWIDLPYQHAYGWYSGTYGTLMSGLDSPKLFDGAMQELMPTGRSVVWRSMESTEDTLEFAWLPRDNVFSVLVGDVPGYGKSPLYPFTRQQMNHSFQCLWQAIRSGAPFRFYPENNVQAVAPGEAVIVTGTTATSWCVPPTLPSLGFVQPEDQINTWRGMLALVETDALWPNYGKWSRRLIVQSDLGHDDNSQLIVNAPVKYVNFGSEIDVSLVGSVVSIWPNQYRTFRLASDGLSIERHNNHTNRYRVVMEVMGVPDA